tara:strand:- start:138 stop:242 length:105 start_codon:yes stop_codon:yes gene_type:complete
MNMKEHQEMVKRIQQELEDKEKLLKKRIKKKEQK